MNKETLNTFFIGQLIEWPEVATRYRQLKNMQIKYLRGVRRTKKYKIIYNPSRVQSVTANTESKTSRCPLCKGNRPEQQNHLLVGNRYSILVNPYPIFSRHLTIAAIPHTPQQIDGRFPDMLKLAKDLEEYTIYYNGLEAGASVPGHMHFQAALAKELPLKYKIKITRSEKITSYRTAELRLVINPVSFLLTATNINDAIQLFDVFYDALSENQKKMSNILTWYEDGKWYTSIYIRRKHRPDIYYKDYPEKLTVSPAAVEMERIIVTINQEDFDRIDKSLWEEIVEEINMTDEDARQITEKIMPVHKPYQVHVGILEAPVIEFNLLTPCLLNGKEITGQQTVIYEQGRIKYNDELYKELLFIPSNNEGASVEVSNVTIGKEFHWQENQTQQFSGSWHIIPDQGKLIGINILDMEEYLKSVISSEMSPHAPFELLKTHAIIARTWLIRMIERKTSNGLRHKDDELRWHEAEEHTLYDVCADDHCQRYQGTGRITNHAAKEAVEATRGQVITYQKEVIDARYSKCCGGITEEFSTAWGNIDYKYLVAVRDTVKNTEIWRSWIDKHIDKWVLESPDAWCNVTNPEVLSSIMNDFDLKTTDYYRWTVEYSAKELAEIILSKTGIDPGEILDLELMERGPSGRLWKIKIVGTLHSWIIGKELEIRRALSPTHLYSSAFTVNKERDFNGRTSRFILHGAGWGHGVGLCQIGAANMAANGYKCEEIILHYYKKTELLKIYE